ncbi:MAG TPA: hypothetical protein VMJ10_21505 [Kofleriaceae bacterium]|nr:hypothetical protein [Kofleriaceae bacterium]
MKGCIIAIALALAACHHDSGGTTEPADPPKAGTTPVAYLLDDAKELRLRAEQSKQLKDIDTVLAKDLEPIDARLHDVMHPGFVNPRRDPVPDVKGRTSDAKRLMKEREARVDNALHRALDTLDAEQRPVAVKILGKHDIDVDEQSTDDGSGSGSANGSANGSDSGSDGGSGGGG